MSMVSHYMHSLTNTFDIKDQCMAMNFPTKTRDTCTCDFTRPWTWQQNSISSFSLHIYQSAILSNFRMLSAHTGYRDFTWGWDRQCSPHSSHFDKLITDETLTFKDNLDRHIRCLSLYKTWNFVVFTGLRRIGACSWLSEIDPTLSLREWQVLCVFR